MKSVKSKGFWAVAKDPELRERAEELYVIDGMTQEEVSRAVGVSERTVASWAAEGQWKERQKEYRNAASEIRRYTRLTKLKLIKAAMTSLDPQQVYAFSALERATSGARDAEAEIPFSGTVPEIRTPQEAVDALQRAVEAKLGAMLSQPGAVSFAGIRDMKKAMELLEDMRVRYPVEGGTETRKRGLSDDTVDEIKRRILGIS